MVDVEIAMFGWVLWWKDSWLHQSFGYRRSAGVGVGFWVGNPDHGRMEIKADA